MSFSIDQYDWPIRPGLKPFGHQRSTTLFVLKHKRCLVLNEMGTGKTLSALWACDILMRAEKIRRVLIVSPLSTMKSVWGQEVILNMPHRRLGIAHGTRQQRIDVLKSQLPFVVINHDGVKILEDEIIDEQFDVIIIDELTAFKSSMSDRSKAMERVAKAQSAKHNRRRRRDGAVWGMSGDITPNAPTEAWYQCKIVVPDNEFLPKYFGQFRDACMEQVTEQLWVPKAIAPNIVSMVARPAIRFTRDECLDLPDTSYHDLEIDLTPEQTRAYKMMRDRLVIQSDDERPVTAANAAVLLNKLCQISAGAVKSDDGSIVNIGCQPRLDALLEIFEGTPQKKLVVFATYRATIDMLVETLSSKKIQVAAIHGDVNQNLRATHIERFQNGDLQVLVLQPQSSAHGITLTASSTTVWFSLIASNELYQQGNARIVRAGQSRKTIIYRFIGSKAERHLAKILDRKGKMSEATLDLFRSGDL